MDHVCSLFFELSHEDRLQILWNLVDKPLKLTYIAETLNCSSQEAYRHLSRLQEANLVKKTPEGDYTATSYGQQIMRLIPGYDFLSKHSQYFLSRNLSMIPDQFMNRIGELDACQLVNDVMVTLFDMEVLLNEAEEYVCVMTNQMVMSHYEPIIKAANRGVSIRILRPKGWRLPDEVVDKMNKETIRQTMDLLKEGKVIQREPPVLSAYMAFSEKQVAALSFAKNDGDLDYLAFRSADKKVHKWCLDFYNYFWDMAQPAVIRSRVS